MNGPKLWAEMLAAVNIPGAVVAGGCIRDCFLSVEPKDIDIAIPAASCNAVLDIVDELKQRGIFHGDMMNREEYEEDEIEEGSLFGVASGEILGQRVDIISRRVHLEGPWALIESFDFHILQCYFDGERVVRTQRADFDYLTRTATMAHDRHIEQSVSRFLRFNARNPGLLSLNIPYEYEPCSIPATPS